MQKTRIALIPVVSSAQQKAYLGLLNANLFPSTFEDNPGLSFELRAVDEHDVEILATATRIKLSQVRHAAETAWASPRLGLTERQRDRGFR